MMVPQKLRGETPSTQELDLRLQRKKAAELMLISLNGSKTLEKKKKKTGNRNQLCCLDVKATVHGAIKDNK